MSNAHQIIDEQNIKAAQATDVVVPDDLPDQIAQGVRSVDDREVKRIVVDRAACIGARSCVVVAQGLFEMDDENLAYVQNPDAFDQETLKLAAESCPVLAIHLYTKEGKKIFPQ